MSDTELKLIKRGLAGFALFLLLNFAGCYGLSKVEYSTGYRDGTIQKLSTKGVFFKTVEGDMILGGLQFQDDGSGGGTMNRQMFQFTVADPEVQREIEALPTGKKVRLHYRQMVSNWKPSGSTAYFVTKVEEVK